MSEEVIQKLTKKLIEGVKVDIPVVSPAQEVSGEIVIFLRKYSTNGTIPLATFASLVTFTLSYFISFALTNTKTGNQSIYGYIVTASILSSLLILSLILNSWYRTIAKNEKTGNELLNSDLNKDGKGEIDKIKIILDFGKGRILECVAPVGLSQIDELRQQMRENRYRILLLSIPIVMPAVTLFVMLAANEFNIKNPYIAIPVLILFFSIILAKLSFTVSKAKANKMNDYIFPQFSNKDILLNFGGKSSKITIINEQFKKPDIDKEEDEKTVENNEDEYHSDEDLDEKEYSSPITRSNSSDAMQSIDNEQSPIITENKQETSGSEPWFGGLGAKAGEALGERIAQPIEKAAYAVEQAFTGVLKAAQKVEQRVEQIGCDASELKEPIKQMFADVSNAARQFEQTSKSVSKTADDFSRLIKKLESYLPNENDNPCLKMPLEDILPILRSKLKAKDDSGCLDDTISNLVDGKVIVTYKNGATLEFTTPAKKADAREKMSCFTELRVEDLKMTVKDSFVFDSREL